jgi:hypothetical protein
MSSRDSNYYRTFIAEGYEFLNPLSFEDGRNFAQALSGDSQAARKTPINFRLETESDSGEPLQHATSPWAFVGSPLIVTEEVLHAVDVAIGDAGELLPMDVQLPVGHSVTMWYLHTDQVVHDLDLHNSELQVVLGTRIASIKKLVLTGEHGPYPAVFKLSDCPDFYCYSADLVSRIRATNQISGTLFRSL